jgi:1-acyl-sn-glycerol-3-phosphate acyltransferase
MGNGGLCFRLSDSDGCKCQRAVIFLRQGLIQQNSKLVHLSLNVCSLQVFFHSIMTIFFSSMEVLGKQNIPEHGPVIFTGNHNNQFVDGAVLMITNPKRVGFLVAEKSYKTLIVGELCEFLCSLTVMMILRIDRFRFNSIAKHYFFQAV